jgi:WD40 repeat protein
MADDPDQGALRIWDLAGGEPIGAVIPTGSRVEAVALGTLDGTPIVVALSLHDVRAWDLKNGAPIGRVIEMPEQYQINALELAELKGKTVAVVGGYDHELNMWDVAGGAPAGKRLRHGKTIYGPTVVADHVDAGYGCGI